MIVFFLKTPMLRRWQNENNITPKVWVPLQWALRPPLPSPPQFLTIQGPGLRAKLQPHLGGSQWGAAGSGGRTMQEQGLGSGRAAEAPGPLQGLAAGPPGVGGPHHLAPAGFPQSCVPEMPCAPHLGVSHSSTSGLWRTRHFLSLSTLDKQASSFTLPGTVASAQLSQFMKLQEALLRICWKV